MPNSSLSVIVQQLRAAAGRNGAGRTDGELLTQFLDRRDEDALAALVERHAPMVWGVCRRVLRNPHDAEDAFQATFLVLVQKAATVVPREVVANWLHGVAHQTAVRLRATAAKRGWREVQMDVMPEPAVVEAHDDELLSRLDEELGRLPERFRALIVLCDLEGRTRKEVARQLGCPEGTVASGLARARERLAKRLTRHGLAVSGGSLAATLSQSMASAHVPASVVTSTINVATLFAAGKAAGVISGPVATLTQGVLKTMFLKKILTSAVVVLALGMAVIGGGTLALGQTGGTGKPSDKPPVVAEKPAEPAAKGDMEKQMEPFTAWGKEVGGLQAGLGFKAGEKRAYRHGETVTLVVRMRNVGKEEVTFQYLRHFFIENPPTVTDDAGKAVALKDGSPKGIYQPADVTLAPGEEIELYKLNLDLSNNNGIGIPRDSTLVGAGKFRFQYERVLGNSLLSSVSIKFDPALSKLATGKLELDVQDDLTAWGKEVGGLQAGLGFKAGEQRAYHHGETVTVALRIRNVGKETVDFKLLGAFLVENPPTITDPDGAIVQLPQWAALGKHNAHSKIVAPGKEVEIFEWRFVFRPKGESPIKEWTTIKLPGTGKFSIQCERILGPSSGNPNHPNPMMDKLATGKLELEVNSDPPPAEKKPKQKQEEGLTAWGKEVGGLQAGLGFPLGAKRVYSHGETVKLVLRLRNTGKEEVEFKHIWAYFVENPPTITDADGKLVQMPRPLAEGLQRPRNPKVAPGKEIELYELFINVRPKGETSKTNKTIHGTGKFNVQYERIVGPTSGNPEDPNPAMSKLATGKLELEVKEAQAEKEAFTSWGKEVGGLQAGLGFKAGQKRAYRHGETVTLIVRVRNVGKEEVKFQYLRQYFIENPPLVTDGKDKLNQLGKIVALGVHVPVEVNLAAGKEIELYEWKPYLGTGTEDGIPKYPYIFGTGKFQVQYEKVLGKSSSGFIKLDPALAMLATGKLELEVKEAQAEKQKVLTPEEAVKIAGDNKLTKEFNEKKPAVEFKVDFVTKAIQVKVSGEKDAGWVHGHSPDDVCLGVTVPSAPAVAENAVKRNHIRFVATLTQKVIGQLNKAGINDLEKHFKGKTVRVTGPISRHAYDGYGSPDEVEIVLDDLSQFEVVK